MKRRQQPRLLSSQDAAQRLKVPELALGQLAMDGKLKILDNFKFSEEQVAQLANTDLTRYR